MTIRSEHAAPASDSLAALAMNVGWVARSETHRLHSGFRPAGRTNVARHFSVWTPLSNRESKRNLPLLLRIVLPLFLTLPSHAASPRTDLQTGNARYAESKYDEALKNFESAARHEDRRTLPTALYNKAAALYQLGRYADAREAWVQALPMADAQFEASARYNIGNTHYQEALAASQPQGQDQAQAQGLDASTLIKSLDQAITQYKDAIRLNPQLNDARANLELAMQLKKQIQEQSEPSSQPSQDQQQQQGNQNQNQNQNENQNSSQQQNQQNQNGSGQQNQQSNQNSNGSEQQEQQHDEQDQQNSNGEGQPEQEQENQNENQNGNANSNSAQSGQQNGNENSANQNQSQQDAQQGNQNKSSPQEPSEPEDPMNANRNGGKNLNPADQQGEQDASNANENSQDQRGVYLSPIEADRLLQMVRDAEKARREALRRSLRSRQPPVERDW